MFFSLLKSASSLLHLQPLFWIFHQIQCMSIVSNPCASLILWMGFHVPKLAGRRTSLRTEVKSHRSWRLASRTTRQKTLTSRRPRWSTTALACSIGRLHAASRIAYWWDLNFPFHANISPRHAIEDCWFVWYWHVWQVSKQSVMLEAIYGSIYLLSFAIHQT